MAISEKQVMFHQLDKMIEALSYVKSALPDLNDDQIIYTTSFVDDILGKIDTVRNKIKLSLNGDQKAIPGIQNSELLVSWKKLCRAMEIVHEINAKMLNPSGMKTGLVQTTETKSEDLRIDLPPPAPIFAANERWKKMVTDETAAVNLILAEGLTLYDPSEDPFEDFRYLETDYRDLREKFSKPFLVPGNEYRIRKLTEDIEKKMQKLIDSQAEAEKSMHAISGEKKTSVVMQEHFEELKSIFANLWKVTLPEVADVSLETED